MAPRFLMHPRAARLVWGPRAALRSPDPVASAADVSVAVDPSLGSTGQQFAQQLAPYLQPLYDRVAPLFPSAGRPPVVCVVSRLSPGNDGSGGAYHDSCTSTTLYSDAAYGQPERTAAVFLAELVEVFEAYQNTGWDCGNTNGEALSRCLAEAFCPGVLDDYATAATWLDTPDRPNWISFQQGTDTDPESLGCGVLFLWWLHEHLGFGWDAIVAVGGSTLAETYTLLTAQPDAYGDFRLAVDSLWPLGQPSEVATDNPWASLPTDGPAKLAKLAPGRELVLPGGGRIALAVGLQVLQALLTYFLQQQHSTAPPAAGR